MRGPRRWVASMTPAFRRGKTTGRCSPIKSASTLPLLPPERALTFPADELRTDRTFGVPGNLASIWPDLISTPLLTRFAWSSLIELAFDMNRDLFLPSSLLADTPYLSSLPYDTSTSTNAARYPPIPGLMAIHVRKGDYASHCGLLATIGDPFVSVNNFPALPDAFLPPGVPGPVMPNGKVAGNWHASAAQRTYYRERCYPSIPEIVAKVMEVRASDAGKGIRRLHIMTNGKPAYIANLKRALWDAMEWDAISSSRDLVLNWEQKFVAQAVDVLVAQRAQVLIGNGVSIRNFLCLLFSDQVLMSPRARAV